MATTSAMLRPTTVIAATAGTVLAGLVGYAIYFDHRRRTDPEFRKALKREAKMAAKSQKQQQEQAAQARRNEIREIVQAVNREPKPSPTEPEEIERYFMEELAKGEKLCADDTKHMEAATCFFRALKVYHSKSELINIYDKTVPKPILDILAQMIALDDSSLSTPSASGSGLFDLDLS